MGVVKVALLSMFIAATTGAWVLAAATLLLETFGVELPWTFDYSDRGACNAPPGC